MDKESIHDMSRTSSSEGSNGTKHEQTSDSSGTQDQDGESNDTEDEQTSHSSGTQDQHGESYLCRDCGSRNIARSCSGMSKGRAERIPIQMGSPLSPPGQSPSPENLEQAETCERLEKEDEVPLLDWHAEVEITETEPMLPPQPISKGLKLRVIGPMPEAVNSVKDVLVTGILGGFRVRYMRFEKILLTGNIAGRSGLVVCDCNRCKGKTTVSLSGFERHAGSTAKKTSRFIYIDNGKSLYEVMEAARTAAENGKPVRKALQVVMGPDPDKSPESSSQSVPRIEGDEEEITGDRKQRPLVPKDYTAKKTRAMSTPNLAGASSPPQISPNTTAAAELSSSSSNTSGSNILSTTNNEEAGDSDNILSETNNDVDGDSDNEQEKDDVDGDGDSDNEQEKNDVVEKIKFDDSQHTSNAEREIYLPLAVDSEQLFAYPIDWDIYDNSDLHLPMERLISEEVTERVGREGFTEEDLIMLNSIRARILRKFSKHVTADKLLNMLKFYFDDDAYSLFYILWRNLINEIRLIEILVPDSEAQP